MYRAFGTVASVLRRSMTAGPVLATAMCLVGVLTACAPRVPPVVAPPPPPIASLPVEPLVNALGTGVELRPDPAWAVIALAEAEFRSGERELAGGRVVAARERFDAAVDRLTALPAGARSDVAIAAAFDLLLDRISALEIQALRDGDGLTEVKTEPAALDELLEATTFELPQPAATTADTVRADLARSTFGLDIPANDRVLAFVEAFQGRLHEYLVNGLERGNRYLPMIQRIFEEEGLPAELVYVPLVESAFKPNALSRASARGMWQFMPGTGLEHGLKQNWFVDERSDPEKSTRAAAQYLKTLVKMFDGDWSLALASYNGGPGRVQRAIRSSRRTDFWSLTATTRYLPRETRNYVPMIMAAIIIAKNPALYGFDVGVSHPLAYERVTVPGALDLKIIAEWVSVGVDELRDLNPELRRTTTPTSSHELKVPVGTAATIDKQLVSAEPLFARFNFHTVRRGETLSSVARRYKVSLNELRRANELSARARVRAGQSLMIPQRPAASLPTTASRSATPTTVARAGAAASATTYRVVRGDTLFSIARRFDTTVDAIKQLNRLRSNNINIGDRLTVR
jgi:membrane-bound lytic murein transglycosylase D